ncbi:hypothetical protein K1T71_001510 [Dendrolimus kikuchii]|uniref:Uncharacterized protein n=1 Tax=Dendrolimus kikuchii TaxID=765133 RepID=A0ACC1DIF9_9NEOP|nr:hypothetical protein K1T71_001510 [Dendrolimus kikuchii]
MDNDNMNFQFPICDNIPSDIAQSSTIIEEGPRVCPDCSSVIRLYFINFHEQVQMCENVKCDFPFSQKDIQFVKYNVNIPEDDDMSGITQTHSVTGSMSVVSTAAWAEIDKINNESEESQFDSAHFSDRDGKIQLLKQEKTAEKNSMKFVQSIRNMNRELNSSVNKDLATRIQDKKLINQLRDLQYKFGSKWLKDDELVRVNKKEPVIGLGELKIDIGGPTDILPTITIEINNEAKNQSNSQQ